MLDHRVEFLGQRFLLATNGWPGFAKITCCLLFLLGPNPNRGECYQTPSPVMARVNAYEITQQAAIRIVRHSAPYLLPATTADSWQPIPVPRPRTTNPEQTPAQSEPDISQAQALPQGILPAAVEQLVRQRIVYEYLLANGAKISQTEIELEQNQLVAELKSQGTTLEQFMIRRGLSESELQYEIGWKLGWRWYLKQILTDDYLEAHYRQHQRQFDGSRMRVAHLLLNYKTPDQLSTAIASAVGLKNRLMSVSSDRETAPAAEDRRLLNWDQAVAEYSHAPTRDQGGEIGWISFAEPMPPSFSNAAFQLRIGEVSDPIVTPFGVHLIKALELKEGKIGWRDAYDQVKKDAAVRLFEQIATHHRGQVKIEFLIPLDQ